MTNKKKKTHINAFLPKRFEMNVKFIPSWGILKRFFSWYHSNMWHAGRHFIVCWSWCGNNSAVMSVRHRDCFTVYEGKVLLSLSGRWFAWGFPPHLHRLRKVHRLSQSCRTRRTLFSTPSVTELLLSHPVLFLINQPGQHPHISVALRKGIYHSAADQIWHGPSRAGNSRGGYTYTVDLLAWYTGQSRIKYVPRDTSHSSWSCHELIFTTRTSRNWKTGGDAVASWPCKQSRALKVLLQPRHAYRYSTPNVTFSLAIQPSIPSLVSAVDAVITKP